ncbi:PREDICTED: uncharacterized protein LOC109214919 [Nicotiana attenuata]|uniref:uncharacterized protein LOC109214919 n=1 Tax=Nicotiana attenuata TaxID=49451 RepID=UPI0009048B61|nr:PREDICTED: uncharacterized protein LOC109214919 [Nicotiana attenuata]
MTTVRALITVAVKKGWDIFQLDVNNAFLHGDLYEEVYMEVPPDLLIDHSNSHKMTSSSTIFVAVYVDDVIVTGTDSAEIANLKAFLDKQFRIKDLGKLHYFLGLEVLYKSDGVLVSQRKFALDLLKEYDCFAYNNLSSPLDPSLKLKANEGTLLPDTTYYRKLIGKMNFLTNTRLDITYSVQLLSQFMQAPRDTHLTAAFHLFRYLMKDPTLGIFFSNSADCSIYAYCDSDWASCPDSRRSITGYIVLVGDSPISWKSKKQETNLLIIS